MQISIQVKYEKDRGGGGSIEKGIWVERAGICPLASGI